MLIIRDLMFKSKQSFGEFLTSNEKTSPNILTDLLPIMLEITQWSGRYYEEVNTPKAFLTKLEEDKAGVIRQIRSGWEDEQLP